MILLEIYSDVKLKDSIVDMLLEEGFDDFYYLDCNKYAATSLLLSEKEQVSGRKDYGLFRIFTQEEIGRALGKKIYSHFGREEIRIIFLAGIMEF
ncbi:DUF3240 family protein [Helicobacter sp. 13S00477-4]|uniref:DUF3240 family protein n=1 Tax=Helicobacter sp. 13S00477-4 TaxID=1905759 RepID=UPI000BA74A69|nr:DUF3240 family protein [Helicobacter sp. 13S00477-4]PAF51959.1 hypothetical protein BKH44_04675 [Helicobacter sp. 13S00477-4]